MEDFDAVPNAKSLANDSRVKEKVLSPYRQNQILMWKLSDQTFNSEIMYDIDM